MPIWQQGRRAIACLALIMAAGAAHAATKVTVNSPAGEQILHGVGSRTYDTVIVDPNEPGSVRITAIHTDGGFLFIELKAPVSQDLEEGGYDLAEMIDGPVGVTGLAPGMRVVSPSGGCAREAWGSFKIRRIEGLYNTGTEQGGNFEATFSYKCDSTTAKALTGTIVFDTGPRWFSYSRDAAFPIGSATARTFYGDNSDTVLAGGDNAFLAYVSGQRHELYFYFEPPVGKLFAKGVYPLAAAKDATHASLEIFDVHDGVCPNLSGTLNVRNVAYDGVVMTGLYATWTLYCDGQPAKFTGTFHHDL